MNADTDELQTELDAYRDGFCQLAYDKPNPSQPGHTIDEHGEPVDYLQSTYRGEPAWLCAVCLKVTLGVDPDRCDGCGDADDLSAILHGPVYCRTTEGYDGPCLVEGDHGCVCPDEAPATA
jgi:hypothetical protein